MLVMGRSALSPPPVTATATVGRDSSSSSAESSFRELEDVFLQTQTRIWLGEVLHTRFDEQLHICDMLSDGKLLFEVSKTLWNMLLVRFMELRHVTAHKPIPFGSRKSSGRYMPYSNVDSFFEVFGLNGIDLFSPSDVGEKKDTRKVCICIRSLSKKARSKQLNVPDFDIVTYTIAMPTDIVGCIRKSLELSKGRNRGPIHRSCKEKRSSLRQKNSVAACEQSNESYPDSDEAKSSSVGPHSYVSYTDSSHVDPLDLHLENSFGLHSTVKEYKLPQDVSRVEMQDQETDEPGQCRYYSEHLPESVESISMWYVRNDGQLNNISSPGCTSQVILCHKVKHLNAARRGHGNSPLDLVDVVLGEGNDASSLLNIPAYNREEESHISQQLAFSDPAAFRIDNNESDHVVTDEDCVSSSRMDNESYGSNSTPETCKFGVWGSSPDDIDDVEVSSTTRKSSIFNGRVLQFDFDAKSECDEDDPRTTKLLCTEVPYYEAESLDNGIAGCHKYQDIAKYERRPPLDSATLDTEEFHIGVELESSDLFVESLPYWDDWSSYTSTCRDVELVKNQNGLTQRNSRDDLWVKNTNLIGKENDIELVGKIRDHDKVVTHGRLFDSDPDIKELADIFLHLDCRNKVVDRTTKDSNGTHTNYGVEERCHINFQRQCTTFQDVGREEGMDAPRSDIFANNCESSAEKHPYLIGKGSNDVDKACHQASINNGSKDLQLSCAEHTHEVVIEDERKDSNVDYMAEGKSDKRNYKGAGEKQNKPTLMGPLLKTVAKGTALIGVLFLLHLRIRKDREKKGERWSSVQKSNGMQFSSRKGEKRREDYPAEKLKLED